MEKLFRQQEPPKGGGVFRTGRLFPAPENLCALRGKLEEGDFCSNSRVAIGKYPTKECVRILEVRVWEIITFGKARKMSMVKKC